MRRWTWPFVFLLVALTFVAGVVLISDSTKDMAQRDIGTSFIGTRVTGFMFAVVGQVLAAQGKRRDFLLNLAQSQDLVGADLRGQNLSASI